MMEDKAMKKKYNSPELFVYPLGKVDAILMASTTSFDGYLETPQNMDILDETIIENEGDIG